MLCTARGSKPATAVITHDASSAVLASVATRSVVVLMGMTPYRLTRPQVVFNPTTPWSAAGIRMDPPPSVPMAAKAERVATAAPEPALEPPGEYSGFHALRVGGTFWPYANS